MFFGTKNNSINSKWKVSDFVVGSGNKSRRRGDIDPDERDMETAIKEIQHSFSRGIGELDTVLRELKNKRTEIRARAKALLNDPENESLFHNMDITLLNSQIRVIESKVKLAGDKFKQIRDEKKLGIDKNGKPASSDTNVLITNQNNNPLANAAPNNPARGVFRAPVIINPEDVQQAESKFDTPRREQIEQQTQTPIPCESGAGSGSIAPTSDLKRQSSTPITREMLTNNVMETTADLDDSRRKRVRDRLDNEDISLITYESSQGIDFERSIKAIVNKGKTINKKLFVNHNTGTYYVRMYEVDDNGLEKPCTTETFSSIAHLGVLDFNNKTKTVKPQYEDEHIPYVVVYSDEGMPDYYRDAWDDPIVDKYLIEEETLDIL